MRKFTAKQKEEILDAIDLRLDTISIDEESATEFETKESLNVLKVKIETGDMNFNEGEVAWIKEEIEWKLDMTYAAKENPEIGFNAQGEINSLYNAIEKVIP